MVRSDSFLRNPRVYCCVWKKRPLVTILSQLVTPHTPHPTYCSLQDYFEQDPTICPSEFQDAYAHTADQLVDTTVLKSRKIDLFRVALLSTRNMARFPRCCKMYLEVRKRERGSPQGIISIVPRGIRGDEKEMLLSFGSHGSANSASFCVGVYTMS